MGAGRRHRLHVVALGGVAIPLKRGKSRAVIQYNIRKEIRAGKEPAQAAAIAYRKAGVYRKRIHRHRKKYSKR